MKTKSLTNIAVCSILLFTACVKSEQSVVEIDFEVTDKNMPVRASEFLDDSYDIIQLQNPSNESAIVSAEKYLFTEDRIFAVDRRGNKIVAFDRKGKFIGSTTKMQGKAKNEYISLWDASLDENNKLLYLYCDAPSCFQVLDYDLKYIKTIAFDYLPREFCIHNGKLYSLNVNLEKLSHYDLLCFDMGNLEEKPETLLSTDNAVPELSAGGKCITVGKDVAAVLPFDNNVYTIDDGAIKSVMRFDFGDLWNTAGTGKETDISDFMRKSMDTHWMMTNVTIGDSLVLFNTNRFHTFVADKRTHECDAYVAIDNDILILSLSRIKPSEGLPGKVIFDISAHSVMKYAEIVKNNGWKANDKLLAISETSDESSNPLIIIWKVK